MKRNKLYSKYTAPSTLFSVLANRMNEDELADTIRKCKYILAVIKRRESEYGSEATILVQRISNPVKKEAEIQSEEIILSPYYRITFETIDVSNVRFNFSLKAYQIYLWRNGEPLNIYSRTIKTLLSCAEKELSERCI